MTPIGRQDPDRWLLLLMQLPTRPAAPRIRVWRRLQRTGSIAVRGSVYVLPHSPQSLEDFEWLRAEIVAAGGQASIMPARTLTTDEDDGILQAFRDARSADFKALASSVARVSTIAKGRTSSSRHAAARALRSAQQEFSRLEAIDFGGAPERATAAAALAALEALVAGPRKESNMPATSDRRSATSYRGRTWITRPRPGVDRMSSAWLIRRFIDPKARFEFRAATPPASSRQVPFDMFGVDFGHQGDRCTFEVLVDRFGIDDRAVRRVGEIVHDVDLHDDRYGHPEAAGVLGIVEGLRRTHSDDHDLLEQGIAMIAGLYESFRAATKSEPTLPRTPRRRR